MPGRLDKYQPQAEFKAHNLDQRVSDPKSLQTTGLPIFSDFLGHIAKKTSHGQ